MKKQVLKRIASMLLAAAVLTQSAVAPTVFATEAIPDESEPPQEIQPECKESSNGRHQWSNGVCSACEIPCEHDWNGEGVCKICQMVCSHTEGYDDNGCDPVPTCAETGTHYYECKTCGVLISETEPALGHIWENGRCVRTYEDETICGAVCDHSDVVTDAAAAATCKTEGKTEGSHCGICKMVLKAQETIPVNPENHENIVIDPVVEPTETTSGSSEGSHCAACGVTIQIPNVILPTGITNKVEETECTHANELVVPMEIPATCTTAGRRAGAVCGDCGAVLRGMEEIPASHTVEKDAAVAATCTENGLTEGSHCSLCGKILKKQTTVKATGHKWNEISKDSADCVKAGITEYYCSCCRISKVEITEAALGHKYHLISERTREVIEKYTTKPGLERSGFKIVTEYEYQCTRCGDTIVKDTKEDAYTKEVDYATITDTGIDFNLKSGSSLKNPSDYTIYQNESGTGFYIEDTAEGEGLDSFSVTSDDGNLESVSYGDEDTTTGGGITMTSGEEGASELGCNTLENEEDGMSFTCTQDQEERKVKSVTTLEDGTVLIEFEDGRTMIIDTDGANTAVGSVEEGGTVIQVTMSEQDEAETDSEQTTSETDTTGQTMPDDLSQEETDETDSETELPSETSVETDGDRESESESESESQSETQSGYVEIVFSVKYLDKETETESETTETSKGFCLFDENGLLCSCTKIDKDYHICDAHGVSYKHEKKFKWKSLFKWKKYCEPCNSWL